MTKKSPKAKPRIGTNAPAKANATPKTTAKAPAKAKPAHKTTAKAPAKAKPAHKTARRKLAPVVPVTAPAGGTPAATPGAFEAYQTHLAVAQAIPMEKVVHFRGIPTLALTNVQTGLAAIAPYRAELSTLPSRLDMRAVDQLPGIALGLVYAAAQVNLSSSGTIAQLRKDVAASRTLLLLAAKALVAGGMLPAADVQHILKGKGSRDNAQDCIDLAQLFTNHAAAIAGKTHITADQIATASRVGNQLLQTLKPATAPSVKRNVANPAAAIRDQFATLLATNYPQLLRAGMWIWADAVYDHIPALWSHSAHKKKAPKTPAAPTTPVNPTTTTP